MPDAPDPDPLTKVIGALRAGVDELARLAEHPKVKNALGGLVGALSRDDEPPTPAGRRGPPPTPAPPSTRARPSKARTPPAPAAAPVAVPGGGGRRAELLEMITKRPGLSIPQAAKQLGIAPGGLYGIARKLEAEGLIRKEGSGWHPAS